MIHGCQELLKRKRQACGHLLYASVIRGLKPKVFALAVAVFQPTHMQVPMTILQEKSNLQPLNSLSEDSAELLKVFIQVSSSIKSRGFKVSSLSINPQGLTNTLNFLYSVYDRASLDSHKHLVCFFYKVPIKKMCLSQKGLKLLQPHSFSSPHTEFS